MDLKLERNTNNGVIKSNGARIILKGGFHSIFEEIPEKGGTPPVKCLVKPGQTLPFVVSHIGHAACQNDNPEHAPCRNINLSRVAALNWDSEPASWNNVFDNMDDFDCNFLRIWLTGGMPVRGTGEAVNPLSMTPFLGRTINEKWTWRVYDAIEHGTWNRDYFLRLQNFVTEAENRGKVVQISLFNYFDLEKDNGSGSYRTWTISPYNAELSSPQDRAWARKHLVYIAPEDRPDDPDAEARLRQERFIKPPPGNMLRDVQKKFVKKVIRTLGARTNVIYEIMNEPRSVHKAVAEFSSAVTGWISSESNIRQPLISVNAANFSAGKFDIDFWRDTASIPHYDRIDAISYHGLSGKLKRGGACGVSPVDIPLVDKTSISERYDMHTRREAEDPEDLKNSHPTKSLIYCTDGAYLGVHKFPGAAAGEEHLLRVRDGQIETDYPKEGGNSDILAESKKSDLQNWAYWCFLKAIPNRGKAHFQNHSINQVSYLRIRDGYREAAVAPAPETESAEAAA